MGRAVFVPLGLDASGDSSGPPCAVGSGALANSGDAVHIDLGPRLEDGVYRIVVHGFWVGDGPLLLTARLPAAATPDPDCDASAVDGPALARIVAGAAKAQVAEWREGLSAFDRSGKQVAGISDSVWAAVEGRLQLVLSDGSTVGAVHQIPTMVAPRWRYVDAPAPEILLCLPVAAVLAAAAAAASCLPPPPPLLRALSSQPRSRPRGLPAPPAAECLVPPILARGGVAYIIGSGFECCTQSQIRVRCGTDWVPVTRHSANTISFRVPLNTPASGTVAIQSPYGVHEVQNVTTATARCTAALPPALLEHLPVGGAETAARPGDWLRVNGDPVSSTLLDVDDVFRPGMAVSLNGRAVEWRLDIGCYANPMLARDAVPGSSAPTFFEVLPRPEPREGHVTVRTTEGDIVHFSLSPGIFWGHHLQVEVDSPSASIGLATRVDWLPECARSGAAGILDLGHHLPALSLPPLGISTALGALQWLAGRAELSTNIGAAGVDTLCARWPRTVTKRIGSSWESIVESAAVPTGSSARIVSVNGRVVESLDEASELELQSRGATVSVGIIDCPPAELADLLFRIPEDLAPRQGADVWSTPFLAVLAVEYSLSELSGHRCIRVADRPFEIGGDDRLSCPFFNAPTPPPVTCWLVPPDNIRCGGVCAREALAALHKLRALGSTGRRGIASGAVAVPEELRLTFADFRAVCKAQDLCTQNRAFRLMQSHTDPEVLAPTNEATHVIFCRLFKMLWDLVSDFGLGELLSAGFQTGDVVLYDLDARANVGHLDTRDWASRHLYEAQQQYNRFSHSGLYWHQRDQHMLFHGLRVRNKHIDNVAGWIYHIRRCVDLAKVFRGFEEHLLPETQRQARLWFSDFVRLRAQGGSCIANEPADLPGTLLSCAWSAGRTTRGELTGNPLHTYRLANRGYFLGKVPQPMCSGFTAAVMMEGFLEVEERIHEEGRALHEEGRLPANAYAHVVVQDSVFYRVLSFNPVDLHSWPVWKDVPDGLLPVCLIGAREVLEGHQQFRDTAAVREEVRRRDLVRRAPHPPASGASQRRCSLMLPVGNNGEHAPAELVRANSMVTAASDAAAMQTARTEALSVPEPPLSLGHGIADSLADSPPLPPDGSPRAAAWLPSVPAAGGSAFRAPAPRGGTIGSHPTAPRTLRSLTRGPGLPDTDTWESERQPQQQQPLPAAGHANARYAASPPPLASPISSAPVTPRAPSVRPPSPAPAEDAAGAPRRRRRRRRRRRAPVQAVPPPPKPRMRFDPPLPSRRRRGIVHE